MAALLASDRRLGAGPSQGRGCSPLVMVAEDHDDTRFMLRTLLERRGFLVVEAGDGEEAILMAERERPDLILMDGSLPLLDGINATRRIRRLESLSSVPIVFVSGHAAAQDRRAAQEAGCDDYLVKPLDIDRLDRVILRLLGGGQGAPARAAP